MGAGSSRGAPESGPRTINIGIETEFLLGAYRADHSAGNLEDFAKILAADHNLRVRGSHLKMRRDLRPSKCISEYTDWCLTNDETIARQRSPCKPLPSRVTSNIADTLIQGELSWYHQSSGPFPAQHGGKMWKRLGNIFNGIMRS